jgi:hypothetical protein
MQAFISYTHQQPDKEAAERLRAELENRGVTVAWTDRFTAGESWASQLIDAIRNSDFVLVLVSHESLRSEWVTSETALAVSQAQQGRTRVVPVLLSRKVELPPILQYTHGITFFDPDFPDQLDRLVKSVKATLADNTSHLRSKHFRSSDAEVELLKDAKEALRTEIRANALQKAVRSTEAITSMVGHLSGVFVVTIVAYLAWLVTGAERPIFGNWGFLLPFTLGVLASLLSLLIYEFVKQRFHHIRDREAE